MNPALENAFAIIHSADRAKRGLTLTGSEVAALAAHLDAAQEACEKGARTLRIVARGAEGAFEQTCEKRAQALEAIANA